MAKYHKKKGSKKNINKHKNVLNKPLEYISRTRAIKKLQISIVDFRRLCILKGIYPQVPTNKKFNKRKTYYFKNDIRAINRGPVLTKFRHLKTYLKKKRRALKKNDKNIIRRLKKNKPVLSFDHLVKERYPTFDNALEDMSDPLSLICLFRFLPSKDIEGFNPKKSEQIDLLYRQFVYYVIKTNGLRKAFISVKGYYLQADIQGKEIVWLVPHRFCGVLPQKVDYLCLSTFIDFYMTMMKFVNFKLYNDINLDYPPQEKSLFKLSSMKLNSENKDNNSENKDNNLEPVNNSISQKEINSKLLFNEMVFFLSKETPMEILNLIINSFGGKTIIETEFLRTDLEQILPFITHKIVDRDLSKTTSTQLPNDLKTYEIIQPQWVFDCVNEQFILPVEKYFPGKRCPDHLSPFVDNDEEGYVPLEAKYRSELKGENCSNNNEKSEEILRKEKMVSGGTKNKRLNEMMLRRRGKRELAEIKMEEKAKRLYAEKLEEKRKKIKAGEDI